MKIQEKVITAKIKKKKKSIYNLFIFQKTDKIRILSMHSICNYSDDLFSVIYGHIFISFISDLIFPRIFS